MRGVFVSNAFLRGEKFGEPPAMFRRVADKAGVELDVLTNADLSFPVGDRRSAGRILGDADFVLFWDKDVRCAANLELCGYRVFNPSECIGVCDDKSLTHLALAEAGVPSITTVACPLSFSGYDDLSFLGDAADVLGFPMVVKDCFGSFGQQVHLAEDMDSLRRMFEGPFVPRILQRYIECGGRDIRVEVVGGRPIAAMERRAKEGEFRSNATLGGSISPYSPTDDEAVLAISACEAVGADFAGVDIISTPDGPVVCEVNSNAHLKNLLDCTGIDASEAILAHVMEAVKR